MFLPTRPTQKSWKGLKPMGSCRYFKSIPELDSVMETIEIEYDIKLAHSIIADKQREIDKIKENHEIK